MQPRFVFVALVAGSAVSAADVFNWAPSCGSEDWWGACSNGLPSPDCIFFNNWGRSRSCDLGLPEFPGPADDVDGGGSSIRLENNFAHIRSLQMGGPFTFVGGSLKVETAGDFFGPVMIENAHFSGGDFTFHGPIEFPPFGQFIVSDPGTLHIRGPFHWHDAANNFRVDSGAHVILEQGANFEINGAGHIRPIIAPASFTNRGHINKHGPDDTMEIGVTFTNEGMFDVHGGGLSFVGSDNVFGGMIHLHSPVGMFINGPSSTADGFTLMGAGLCTLASTLDVIGHATISRLLVAGTLRVSGHLQVEELLHQNGTLSLAGGTVESPMPVRIEGGALSGNGLIEADVEVVNTTIAPGQSAGLIRVGSASPRNYTQAPASTLEIELEGTAPGTFDSMEISGQASLGGLLRVSLEGGFVPQPGDEFVVLTAQSVHGRFDAELLPEGLEVVYGPDSVRLVMPGCPADLSGASDPNDPAYGMPDGNTDASDFFYYLDQFVAANLAAADLTGSSDPNDPGYGTPDGAIDAADFFYYLDRFVEGCP
jgi:hypothetical protein